MRHRKSGRKFNRDTSARRAMFRSLAGNLILHEQIKTTEAKAKELRRIADRLVTRAARLGDSLTADIGKIADDKEREKVIGARVHAQRLVASYLPKRLIRTLPGGDEEEVDPVYKLFHEIAPRYMERVKLGKGGGYTRIIKLGRRKGDNAPMALIEFLGSEDARGFGSSDAEASVEETADA